jgi:hypothetical protein
MEAGREDQDPEAGEVVTGPLVGAQSAGAVAAAKTATAIARQPDLSKFYKYNLPPIVPGDFTFRLNLLRPNLAPIALDRLVDTLSWVDEASVLTGSITAYRPTPENPATLPITRGQLVQCTVDWDGGSYDLWTMRCEAPQYEVDTGQASVAMKDDMALLDEAKRDWFFRKTKNRSYGYTADEIARLVAGDVGAEIGQLAKGTVRMEIKLRKATALAVLKQAYTKETHASGRSFIIRMRNNRLEIVPLARNPIAYVLGPLIQTALITQGGGVKVPTTVLTGHGHVGSGKASQKVSYTEYDRRVVNLLGYSHDTLNFGKVDSQAQLKAYVQRTLARRLRVNADVSIQHQGIPFILRGDAVEVDLPTEGYKGANAFVFCTSATHTVSAGVYQTNWDFTYQDPYLAELRAAAKAAKQRSDKSKKRALKKKKAGFFK